MMLNEDIVLIYMLLVKLEVWQMVDYWIFFRIKATQPPKFMGLPSWLHFLQLNSNTLNLKRWQCLPITNFYYLYIQFHHSKDYQFKLIMLGAWYTAHSDKILDCICSIKQPHLADPTVLLLYLGIIFQLSGMKILISAEICLWISKHFNMFLNIITRTQVIGRGNKFDCEDCWN